MATSNRVDVLTNNIINKGIADTVLGGNVLTVRNLMAAKKWGAGKTWDKTVKVSSNTNLGSFSGLDLFTTSSTDNQVKFSFTPKFYRASVTLVGTDLSINKNSGGKVEDMMEVEVQSTMEDMADDIGTLFYSDGTGNSSKDFLGLTALIDDGNTVALLGGLSRSTYSTLASTVTASGGTLTLAKLATLDSAIAEGSQLVPTLNLTTETVGNLFEQLLQPQERIMKDAPMMKGGLVMGTGSRSYYYRGKPVMIDPKATSGVWFMVNENFHDFAALPHTGDGAKPLAFKSVFEGTVYSNVTGLGFTATDWLHPDNSSSLIKHIYLGGEYVGWNPVRSGKLTGITSV